MIKKCLAVLATGLFCLSLHAQVSTVQYINNYIRVWGFLKYYHPAIASGKMDADSLFLKHADEVRKINNKKAYQKMLLNIQHDLGKIKPVIPAGDTTKLFSINDQSSRVFNDKLVPLALRRQMKLLHRQGYTDSFHQYMPATFFATELPAEKAFENIQYPDPNYQLLSLARYWNAIAYLFPYKYMISKSWDLILKEQVKAFAEPMTSVEFEQHLLQLNAAIEDSHGGIVAIRQSGKIYGAYFPPFTFRFAGDSIVITDYIDSISCLRQNILKGDIITGIRGKSIAQQVAACDELVSASNLHKKKSLLSSIPLLLPLRGMDSIIAIRIVRNNEVLEKQLVLQKPDKKFIDNINPLYRKQAGYEGGTKNDFILRSLNKDVVQVDAAALSILFNNSIDDKAIDSVLQRMLAHKKAILLDMRCYSTQAVFYNKFLPALGWRPKPFLSLQAHFQRSPGNYYEKDIFSSVPVLPGMPAYPGKVILLVNEETHSQSEMISMILQASGPVIVAGTQTSGSDGDVIRLPMPGGYSLIFSGRHVAYRDGTASQKLGVRRDIIVNYTTAGIAKGRDEVLEAALEFLK